MKDGQEFGFLYVRKKERRVGKWWSGQVRSRSRTHLHGFIGPVFTSLWLLHALAALPRVSIEYMVCLSASLQDSNSTTQTALMNSWPLFLSVASYLSNNSYFDSLSTNHTTCMTHHPIDLTLSIRSIPLSSHTPPSSLQHHASPCWLTSSSRIESNSHIVHRISHIHGTPPTTPTPHSHAHKLTQPSTSRIRVPPLPSSRRQPPEALTWYRPYLDHLPTIHRSTDALYTASSHPRIHNQSVESAETLLLRRAAPAPKTMAHILGLIQRLRQRVDSEAREQRRKREAPRCDTSGSSTWNHVWGVGVGAGTELAHTAQPTCQARYQCTLLLGARSLPQQPASL